MEDILKVESNEISKDQLISCTDLKEKQLERIQYWKKEFDIISKSNIRGEF